HRDARAPCGLRAPADDARHGRAGVRAPWSIRRSRRGWVPRGVHGGRCSGPRALLRRRHAAPRTRAARGLRAHPSVRRDGRTAASAVRGLSAARERHACRAGRAAQSRRSQPRSRRCRPRGRRRALHGRRAMTPTTLDSDLRSGDHLCAIYDTDADWLVTAVPYFSEGLARHEACVYVAPESHAAHLEVALRAAGLDVDAHVRRGALRFATPEATYLRPGRFDPDVMIALWQELIDAAGAEGYTNLRVAGCPTWINDGVPGAERWAEYEAQVSECFRGRRLIKLCQYDRRLFSPTVLLDVLHSHPFAVVQGAVRANPFAGMASARAERDRRKPDQDLQDALTREREIGRAHV